MPTYKIKKTKNKTYPVIGCCGYDVDANEDGCVIVPCDCNICTNQKRIQLTLLIEEMNNVSATRNLDELITDWKDKITKINNNEEVYK